MAGDPGAPRADDDSSHPASPRPVSGGGSPFRMPRFLGELLGWPALLIVGIVVGGWMFESWLSHSGSATTAAPTRSGASAPGQVPGATSAVGRNSEGERSAAPDRNAGTPAATHPQMILELLSAARVQFHDQKLLFPRNGAEPRGDSALELYTQVLSQDPNNAEALDGISRLWAIAKGRIQNDIAGGRLDDAAALLGFFKSADVSDEMLRPVTLY